MAKLISALKIRGTIDDLSFCLQQDGTVVVQAKPGPRREQVKTGKHFDQTRRNASEFGKVTRDAMLLRHALGYITKALRHSKLNSYVIKRLHPIAISDPVSTYGSRHVNKGNIQLLEGFDYNHLLSLETALPVKLEHAMDLASGQLQLRVPGCIVRRKKVFPAGATHFRIVSCAAALNFDKHRYSNHIVESELLPLSKQMPAIELQHQLVGKPGEAMVHTVGMVFYKVEAGEAVLLSGGTMRVVEVVRVEEVERPGVGVQDTVGGMEVRESVPVVNAMDVEVQPAVAVGMFEITAEGALMEVDASGLEVAMPKGETNVPGLEVVAGALEMTVPVSETDTRLSEVEMERLETNTPALIATTVKSAITTVALTTVTPLQAIEKVRCAPCILHNSLLFVEEERATDVMQVTPTDAFEDASHETDDFAIGITDAMGLPLQDKEMQQVFVECNKEPRKRSRLKGYLGRRLE
jgi:hypothetical protein